MSEAVERDRNETIEFKLLTESRIEEAIALQQRTMRYECVALGVSMFEEKGAAEEMELIFREIIKDGLTVTGIDVETGRLVAVAFNRLHERPNEPGVFAIKTADHQACIDLTRFLETIESKVDLFERYNASAMMEIFYVGTCPTYRNRRIATRLIDACLKLGRQLQSGQPAEYSIDKTIAAKNILPKLAFGVFTSTYSQRIAERLGFQALAELRYDEYYSQGRKMSERIGETHEKAVLAAIQF